MLPAPLRRIKPYIVPLLRCLLGGIFLVAGVSKLFPLSLFYAQMAAYHLPIPMSVLKFFAVPLIALEVCLGLALLLHSNLTLALRATQLLLLMMIPVTIWGAMHKAPTCGCFPSLVHRESLAATIEDIIMLILCFVLYPRYKQNPNSSSRMIEVFIVIATLLALGWGFWQYSHLI